MSWYKPETPSERAINLILRQFSPLYFVGAYLRLKAYGCGLLPRHRLPCPVVSIGNLTVGGTGKTPVVIDIAKRLVHEGFRVGILSRGYKRKSIRPVVVVSDGKSILADVGESGDEPFLIATACPKAVVIVGADRLKTGMMAVRDYGCNILLLDDGFQHLRLVRDTDVVLLDYNDAISDLHLLPGGRLREPFSGLSRAGWVVLSKVPANACPNRIEAIRRLVRRFAPSAQFTMCRFEADSCHQLYPHENVSVTTQIKGQKVLAFCGVARPENFFEQLQKMGAIVVGRKTYPDHHWMSEKEMDELVSEFRNCGAQIAVTTGKDAVRLSDELIGRMPVAKLRQRTEWLGDVPLAAGVESLRPTLAGAPR